MASKVSHPIDYWDEKRIDIIGQNGNTGEHYEPKDSKTAETQSPHPHGTVRSGKDTHPRDYAGEER